MTSTPGLSSSRRLPSRAARVAAFLALLLVPLAWAPALQAAAPPSFAGHWEGELSLPSDLGKIGIKLDLHPSQSHVPWTGTMDIPAQGAADVPVTDIQIDGERIHFVLFTGQDNPTFEGTLKDGKIDGTFAQGDIAVPFWLGRERMVDPPKP